MMFKFCLFSARLIERVVLKKPVRVSNCNRLIATFFCSDETIFSFYSRIRWLTLYLINPISIIISCRVMNLALAYNFNDGKEIELKICYRRTILLYLLVHQHHRKKAEVQGIPASETSPASGFELEQFWFFLTKELQVSATADTSPGMTWKEDSWAN